MTYQMHWEMSCYASWLNMFYQQEESAAQVPLQLEFNNDARVSFLKLGIHKAYHATSTEQKEAHCKYTSICGPHVMSHPLYGFCGSQFWTELLKVAVGGTYQGWILVVASSCVVMDGYDSHPIQIDINLFISLELLLLYTEI